VPSIKQRFTAAIKAIRFAGYPTYSSYGGYGGHTLGNFGGGINFAAAAGEPLDNSIVAATVGWVGRTMPEAPIRVVQETPKGEEPVLAHPLTMKLRRPNPFDSGSLLWSQVMLSYILDGNAYLIKERTLGGDVLNLWYVPHWTMEPRWPANGSIFIDHYDYRVDGHTEPMRVEDVVHLRNGKDPRNTRKGLSQIKSVIREIASDNVAIQYSYAMMSNYGTPSAIISPLGPDQTLEPELAAAIKQDWKEKTTGSRRGEAMVSLGAIKVDIPTFSPQQMNVRDSQLTPEERISAVIGIPAIVVGLGAGLVRSTFANYEQSREAAYQSYLIPTQRTIGEQLTIQLLPDFSDDPAERVDFDYSKVRALSEDQTVIASRAKDLFAAGIIDRARALTMVGDEPRPVDEGVYFLPRGGSFSGGEIAEPVSAIVDKVDTEPPSTDTRVPPALAAANGHSTTTPPTAVNA
jgi:HK97 family phage portal protein